MRAILAGGGTGGHVIPALAIAQQLKRLYGAEVVFVGTSRGIETRLVPAAGYELKLIEIGPLNRVNLMKRLKTVFNLPRAVWAGMRFLKEFKPDVVISVGGYASGPVSIAAVLKRVPLVIFEPNVVPGFANRMIARRAKVAAVHFKETGKWFPRYEVTGVPVREAFFRVGARPADSKPTLLVFGGSQGSHALNSVVCESLAMLAEHVPGIHVIHQTGQKEYVQVRDEYLHSSISSNVSAFIDDMPEAFAQADVIVCRSGASTVAEIAAAGKCAVFVPLPTSADDHQRRNAENLANQQAGMLIPEWELTPERLVRTVAGLLTDRAKAQSMGAAARKLAHPDAAEHVAKMAREAGKSR